MAIVAVGYVAVSLLHGGYSAEFRAGATIVLWWAVVAAIGLGRLPREPVPRLAVLCGGCLAAIGAFSLLSLGWADDGGRAFSEAVRVAGYLGLFTLVVVGSPRGSGRHWLGGIAIGLVAVATLALGSRLQPELFPTNELASVLPSTRARLSYPFGYWNGLAAAMALAVALLPALAGTSRSRVARAAAVAALPVPILALFLTSSRGGVAAAITGIVVLMAASRERARTVAAGLIGAAGGAVLILVAIGQHELVDGRTSTEAARGQGDALLLLLLVVVVLAAALHYAADGLLGRLRVGRPAAVAAWVVVACVALAGVIASDPVSRINDFTDPPAATGQGRDYVAQHLASGAGNGRAQFWEAAWHAFEAHPIRGIGAGGYEAWWAQHGTLPYYVRDAHSLFLESLGELGIVGFLLIAGFFITALAGGLRARAAGSPVAAGGLALLACGLVSAALDWTWELPAAFAPVVLVAAVLTGPAEAGHRRRLKNGYGTGVATLVVAWVAIVGAGIAFVSGQKLADSRSAVRHGELDRALRSAEVAARIEPWASTPRLQQALVAERSGDLRRALRASSEAIERAPNDWRLWLTEARLRTKTGDLPRARQAFARARQLNPRSPIFSAGL